MSARPRHVPNRQVDGAQSLGVLLDALGHETELAYDGLEALALAAQFRPEVVLLDIGSPKSNGFDVCRRIRERPLGKSVVIVALTGWGQEDDRVRSREAGFDHHMTKPIDLAAVTELLARLPD